MRYDGIDLSGYMMTSCAIPLMASPSVSRRAAAGMDGFEVSSVKLDSIEITVSCAVIPESPLTIGDGLVDAGEVKRRVASLLFRREKRRLELDEDPRRYLMAVLSGVGEPEKTAYAYEFDITFLCDPFFYGREHEITLSSGSNTVRVGGTVETRPIVEITAASSVASITVTNADTDEFVTVSAPYSRGTTLLVDMGSKRATVNGADTSVAITSDFWSLQPGENEVLLSSGSGKLTYGEVWL